MKPRSFLLVAAAGLPAALGGCSWWQDVTGQQSSSVPPQGAANYDNMMAAIGNEPQQSQRLANLGTVSPDKVIIANADMMARGGTSRSLNEAMHNNARSIGDLRRQIEANPSLKDVLVARNVPVNNVVAIDIAKGGGVVVYALPPVQTGELPGGAKEGH